MELFSITDVPDKGYICFCNKALFQNMRFGLVATGGFLQPTLFVECHPAAVPLVGALVIETTRLNTPPQVYVIQQGSDYEVTVLFLMKGLTNLTFLVNALEAEERSMIRRILGGHTFSIILSGLSYCTTPEHVEVVEEFLLNFYAKQKFTLRIHPGMGDGHSVDLTEVFRTAPDGELF